jgi:hypothetical protein
VSTAAAVPSARAPALAGAVRVQGGGIAAACVAHLLRKNGLPVNGAPGVRRPVPAIMLGDMALALLRDVFDRPALFADRHRIVRRVVRWGDGQATTMPHGAVVVSEDELVAELGVALPGNDDTAAADSFTIHSGPPFPGSEGGVNELRRFGSRKAHALAVRLAGGADRGACHVESVADGWLFLLPSANDGCWLLAMGGAPAQLLAQSNLVAPLIAELGETAGSFETAPRLLPQLAGPGWLACGMAAIAFDPICGDGTAHAVREAILAAAVVAALGAGGDAIELATHYQAMLTASLRRHLQISGQFYASGGRGAWWRAQLAGVAEGYDWCTQRLAGSPGPRFALRGYRLVPIEDAR